MTKYLNWFIGTGIEYVYCMQLTSFEVHGNIERSERRMFTVHVKD